MTSPEILCDWNCIKMSALLVSWLCRVQCTSLFLCAVVQLGLGHDVNNKPVQQWAIMEALEILQPMWWNFTFWASLTWPFGGTGLSVVCIFERGWFKTKHLVWGLIIPGVHGCTSSLLSGWHHHRTVLWPVHWLNQPLDPCGQIYVSDQYLEVLCNVVPCKDCMISLGGTFTHELHNPWSQNQENETLTGKLTYTDYRWRGTFKILFAKLFTTWILC